MARSSQIISFISSKGGSGKTTVCASLGTFLSELGFKTLLVDTDAATNGLTLLFLEQLLRGTKLSDRRRGFGLFETSLGELPTVVDIKSTLGFIPAAFNLSDTEHADSELVARVLEYCVNFYGQYDFILLDAQAGVDAYARSAARLADLNVIVSEYDPVSAQGIDRLKLIFSSELSPASTYTLFNKVLPEFASAIGEGLAIARYLQPVPWDADVVRAFAQRDLAINMLAPNPFTLGISEIAVGLLSDQVTNAVNDWRLNALGEVTNPIRSRLNRLQMARWNILRRNNYRGFIRQTGYILQIMLAFLSGILISPSLLKYYLNPTTKYPARLEFFTIMGIVFGLVSLFLPLVLRYFFPSTKGPFLSEEIVQLEAMLEAAEAALSPREPGLFGRRRQSESNSHFNIKYRNNGDSSYYELE